MKSEFWAKKWSRRPIEATMLMFALLALIWPWVFVPILIGLVAARLIYNLSTGRLERFAKKHPKVTLASAGFFLSGFAAFIFIYLPMKLVLAWQSGEIVELRRSGPDIIYVHADNPFGFWFLFGLNLLPVLFCFVLVLGFAYLFWPTQNVAVKRQRKWNDPVVPMELPHEEAEKYRQTIMLPTKS